MTDEVLGDKKMQAFIRSWVLAPDTGGKFEITVNGELVFSKKALGRHAEPGEAKAAILSKLKEFVPNYDDIPDPEDD